MSGKSETVPTFIEAAVGRAYLLGGDPVWHVAQAWANERAGLMEDRARLKKATEYAVELRRNRYYSADQRAEAIDAVIAQLTGETT